MTDPWEGIPQELREKLPEWERLANDATPGPWETSPNSNGGLILLRSDERWQTHLQVVPEEDARFIAAAREAVPALITAFRSLVSRLREAEQQIAEARAMADQLCEPCEVGHQHHLADVMEKHVFRAGMTEGRSRA